MNGDMCVSSVPRATNLRVLWHVTRKGYAVWKFVGCFVVDILTLISRHIASDFLRECVFQEQVEWDSAVSVE